MTEKDSGEPSKYHGYFNYEGQYRESELVRLGFYLQGKPDTPGWRNIFEANGVVAVEHRGRIFPEWAVLDARQLYKEDPGVVKGILELYELSF